VTKLYKDKKFVFLPWTYPDYQSETALQFFAAVRETYHRQLKSH
jgi:hypothetical protein